MNPRLTRNGIKGQFSHIRWMALTWLFPNFNCTALHLILFTTAELLGFIQSPWCQLGEFFCLFVLGPSYFQPLAQLSDWVVVMSTSICRLVYFTHLWLWVNVCVNERPASYIDVCGDLLQVCGLHISYLHTQAPQLAPWDGRKQFEVLYVQRCRCFCLRRAGCPETDGSGLSPHVNAGLDLCDLGNNLRLWSHWVELKESLHPGDYILGVQQWDRGGSGHAGLFDWSNNLSSASGSVSFHFLLWLLES